MISVYLWINAALYALFSVLCFIRIDSTSQSLGYTALSPAGHSEYTVVYGGLQLGLAAFFAYTAYPLNNATKAGLVLALALYVPIVISRWTTVMYYGVRSPVTIGTGVLETVLALAAALLWFSKAR